MKFDEGTKIVRCKNSLAALRDMPNATAEQKGDAAAVFIATYADDLISDVTELWESKAGKPLPTTGIETVDEIADGA